MQKLSQMLQYYI